MAKKAATENIYKEVNLSIPIDKDLIKKEIAEDSCLGKLWDMQSKECPICAMNDICGILFQDVVAGKVKEIEAKHPVFLDKVDFANIDEVQLLADCHECSGVITVQILFNRVAKEACIVDEVAITEWIIAFKTKNNLKFRGGVVWSK